MFHLTGICIYKGRTSIDGVYIILYKFLIFQPSSSKKLLANAASSPGQFAQLVVQIFIERPLLVVSVTNHFQLVYANIT